MTEETLQTLQELVLGTPRDEFASKLGAWKSDLRAEYGGASDERQAEIAEAIEENAVDLQSGLADWKLQCSRFCPCIVADPCREVAPEVLAGESEASVAQLREWGREDLAAAAEAEIASIKASNLLKLTRMSLREECNTWWGNDYATGLRQAMRRGAAMVTTNPVLVNLARTEDPETWTPVRDRLRAENPNG